MITNVIEGSVSDLEEGNGHVMVHNSHKKHHGSMGRKPPQRISHHGQEGAFFPFGYGSHSFHPH